MLYDRKAGAYVANCISHDFSFWKVLAKSFSSWKIKRIRHWLIFWWMPNRLDLNRSFLHPTCRYLKLNRGSRQQKGSIRNKRWSKVTSSDLVYLILILLLYESQYYLAQADCYQSWILTVTACTNTSEFGWRIIPCYLYSTFALVFLIQRNLTRGISVTIQI